ncbi:MAG: hypothetical protein U0798_18550 [Gemmataceae bacterium]
MIARNGLFIAFLTLAIATPRVHGGEITPEGKKLAAFYDGLKVESLWLPREIVSWKTGTKLRDATDNKAHTHCSAFAAAACLKKDVYLLRPPEHSSTLLANAQYDWLNSKGKDKGWKPVASAVDAQHAANRGHLVLATFKESDPKKSGHIALVRPSEKSEKQIAEEGPQIIQAGMENANSTTLKTGFKHHSKAFKDKLILFYVHELTW